LQTAFLEKSRKKQIKNREILAFKEDEIYKDSTPEEDNANITL